MALGGLLHRITPDHYNLYNEHEELVGAVHRVDLADNTGAKEGWYGHARLPVNYLTGVHNTRHDAAREMIDHHARIRADLGTEP